MDEVIKAIMALFAGTSANAIALRAATTGGLWLSQAPQDASGVFIVLTPVSAPISYAQGQSGANANTEECSIQFTLATLTGTATNIVSAMAAAKTLFDFCTFTMTGHTLLVARRLSSQGPLRDDTTRGYTGYLEYRFLIGG